MENMEQERINEINRRIKDLNEHMVMWSKSGGVGGRMAIEASEEIKELELEKEDLLNGTNNLKVYRIQKRLEQLRAQKKYAILFKKMLYSSKIKKAEAELQSLQGKSVKQ